MYLEEERKKIGNQIANERTKKNWSAKELANRLGVSRNTIVNWEKGESEPKASELKKLSKLFSVSYEYLIDGKESNKLPLSIRLSPTEKQKFEKLMNYILKVN